MPAFDFQQTFEGSSSLPSGNFEAGYSVNTTSKLNGANSLVVTATGSKVGLYPSPDSHLGDIVATLDVRWDSPGSGNSLVALIICSTDPVAANLFTSPTASFYRLSITASTAGSTWSIIRAVAGVSTTIGSAYSAPANAITSTKKYRFHLSRRGAVFTAHLQNVTDSTWWNPATNAFQAGRVIFRQVTDPSPLAAANGYYGHRVSLAAGTTAYLDNMTVYPSAAQTYYVAGSGSDSNDGLSTGTPFLTPSKAYATNVGDMPGDVINLNGGDTFTGGIIGTTGRTLQSYGTGRATITAAGNVLRFNDCDAVTIDNLTIVNSTGASPVVFLNSTTSTRLGGGVTITNNDVSGGSHGVFLQSLAGTAGGYNNVTVSDNTVHGGTAVGIGLYVTGTGGPDRHYSAFTIENNLVYNMTGGPGIQGNGIVVYGADSVTGAGAARGVIRGNTIHDIGGLSDTTGAGPGGIVPIYSDDFLVERNLIYNIFAPEAVDGAGMDADVLTTNGEFCFNEVYNCDGAGWLNFSLSTTGQHRVHDNIFANCGTSATGHGSIRLDGTAPAVYFNNTIYQPTNTSAGNGAVVASANAGVLNNQKLYDNLFICPGGAPVIDFGAQATVPSTLVMEGNSYQTTNGTFFGKFNGSTPITSASAWRAALAAANGGAGVEGGGHGFFGTSNPILGYLTSRPTPTDAATMVATNGHFYDPQTPLVGAALDILGLFGVTRGTKDYKQGTISGSGSVGAVSTGLSASLVPGVASGGATGVTTAAATATDATGGAGSYTYQWYRSTAPATLGSAVSGQNTRTLGDTGLAAATTYYYTLRYSDGTDTADSNQITLVTQANLAAGTITVGTITSSSVAATATDATGAVTPYSYQWYRSTASGTLGSALVGQTTRILSDSGLTASTNYYYTIRYTDSSGTPIVVSSTQVLATTSAAAPSTVSIDDDSVNRIIAAILGATPLPVDIKAIDGSATAAQNVKTDFLQPVIPVSAISDDLLPKLAGATIGTVSTVGNTAAIASAVGNLLPSASVGSVGAVTNPGSIATAVAGVVVQLQEIVAAMTPLIPTSTQNATAVATQVGSLGLNVATVLTATTTGFTATVAAPDGTPVTVGSGGFKGMNALPQGGRNFRRTITSHSVVSTTHNFVIDPTNPWPADAVPAVGSLVILG